MYLRTEFNINLPIYDIYNKNCNCKYMITAFSVTCAKLEKIVNEDNKQLLA